MSRTCNQRGFSLAEMLTVCVIIGVLAAVFAVSTTKSRKTSRDANRLAGLLQLQVALESHYEVNRAYPSPCAGAVGGWGGENAVFGGCTTTYIQGLAPTYIAVLPNDPANGNFGYMYGVFNGGQDYKVMVYGSVEGSVVSSGSEYYRCKPGCDAGANPWCTADGNNPTTYAVYSPGAACK